MNTYLLYINGEWKENFDGRIAANVDPATGKPFAQVHMAGEKDVDAAIGAASKAFAHWSQTLPPERESVLQKAADALEDMREEAVALMIAESGSTWRKANAELTGSIGVLRVAAGECRRIGSEVYAPKATGNFSFSYRVPLGVILGIAPFNYPMILAIKKLAYAIAAGDTFVLKPATDTPLSGLIIAKAFKKAGLPAGVLNVVPCAGSLMEKFLVDERIKAITFTGSSSVGKKIAAIAANGLKKYTMELGGKNPMIVLSDYNVDHAVHLAGYGAFFHQGQVCMATSRIIVEEPSYEEFCTKMTARARAMKVGDPKDHDTIIGPLIHESQCKIIDAQIQDALSKGARLLTGGKHKGAYYEPTVLADVTAQMNIFYEESFGPVTSIVKANDSEHALALCNDNHYGLSAALLTNDLKKAMSLCLRMEAGMIHINNTTFVSGTIEPAGGLKDSGFGKEGGKFSIDEFTELRWATIQYEDVNLPC